MKKITLKKQQRVGSIVLVLYQFSHSVEFSFNILSVGDSEMNSGPRLQSARCCPAQARRATAAKGRQPFQSIYPMPGILSHAVACLTFYAILQVRHYDFCCKNGDWGLERLNKLVKYVQLISGGDEG